MPLTGPDPAWLRLLGLVVVVTGRAAALATVVTFTLKSDLGGRYDTFSPGLLAGWLGLSVVPALVLSPLIGVLAGSRWANTVVMSGGIFGFALLAWGDRTTGAPWPSIVALLSLEAAFAGAAVIVLVPGLAREAGLRLTTALVALSVGCAVGLLSGAAIGSEQSLPLLGPLPSPTGVAATIACVSLLVAIALVRFKHPAPLSLAQGLVRSFWAGARDAFRHRRARTALLGLWLWFFVALAAVVALTRLHPAGPPEDEGHATRAMLRFGLAVLGGVLLAGINRHAFRHAWLVPYAATAALACLLWLRFGEAGQWPLVGIGLALGASFTGLLNAYLAWTTPKHHGPAAGLLVAGWCAGAAVLAAVLPAAGDHPGARNALLNILIGAAAVAVAGSWREYPRATLEATVEPVLSVLYRIRAFGPAVGELPVRGPCLVIANHAAWFDPLWLGKALPAPIIPMMTSGFYDLPVISWLMRNVYGTIRVPEARYRREAPELREAVAALDRGECVVVFPEGYLRRTEEQPLRRFGRGVWQILADRPQTPVFACWIEGGWGSYFSYKGGPPTKNKRMDFWRPIRIGVVGPFTVDPTVLGDHMATRTFLMQQVNAARAPLGLEPLVLSPVPEGDKE